MQNPFLDLEQRLNSIENLLRKVLENPIDKSKENKDTIGKIDLAIEITGLKKSTIYSLVFKKNIPHYKRGSRLYFSSTALENWIKSDSRGSPLVTAPKHILNPFPRQTKIVNNKQIIK